MNDFLRLMSWKDYRGRWDSKEVIVDVSILVGAGFLIWFAVWASGAFEV